MKTFRLLLFFVAGLFIGGYSVFSHAETVPATYTGDLVIKYRHNYGGSYLDSPEAVCADLNSAITGTTGVLLNKPNIIDLYGYCGVGGKSYYQILVYTYNPEASCPKNQGWTLTGASCTRPDCVAPQVRQLDGTCKETCKAGESASSPYLAGWRVGKAADAQVGVSGGGYYQPGSVCDGTCQITLSDSNSCFSVGTPYVDTPQAIMCTGVGTKSGTTCSTKTADTGVPPVIPTHSPKCAAGEGVITNSSGSVKCVPSTTPGATTPEVEVTTTKDVSADGSETTQTEVTTVDPATGASTSTTTKTGPGGTTTTTKETTGTDTNGDGVGDGPATNQKSECQLDPDSANCRKGVVSGKGAFNTQSEAVQSAITAYQTKITTISNDFKTTFGTLSAGSGSLPCPPPINVLGRSFEMCIADYNEQLAVIGQFVMLVAALVSAMIVIRV